MKQFLPAHRLVGADVLRDGELQARSVAVEAGRITRGPLPEVDLSGYLVLPGIIDLESASAPDPAKGPEDISRAWRALDRDLATHGVTTAFARQDWSWRSGPSAPRHPLAALAALEALRPAMGTELFVQLQTETHLMDWSPTLRQAAESAVVKQVIFANGLNEALAVAEVDLEARCAQASAAGMSPTEYVEFLRALSKRGREVPRFLCQLAEYLDSLGVLYGSHGDIDGETREFYSMIGARLCLRPRARGAAALARAVSDPVLLSALDLMHPEDGQADYALSDLIGRGVCSALVSSGQPQMLAQAAFRVADRGILPLAKAWELISARAADIARLPDRGRIRQGQRADLVIVEARSRRIEACLSNGRLTYLAGEAATRFMGLPAGLGHAAE